VGASLLEMLPAGHWTCSPPRFNVSGAPSRAYGSEGVGSPEREYFLTPGVSLDLLRGACSRDNRDVG